jgi:type I restriction enzyme S subunit
MAADEGRTTGDELPEGWVWTTLAQVADIGADQILPSRYPERQFNYLALEHIEQGTGKIVDFSPTAGAEIKSNKFRFTPEHVLYGKLRPYLRKAVAPDFDGISATDLLPLKPFADRLDRRFLAWWLLSPQILDFVVTRQTGVKMPRLRSGDLRRMPIPLAPLPEQQRIVAKIEALFRESRRAREALDRVSALIARFRESVLAAAFRGDLTERDPDDEPASALLGCMQAERRRRWEEDLRAQGKDPQRYKYDEPAPPDTSDLPELPEGWVWTNVSQIGDVIGGLTKNAKRRTYALRLPYLRVANVYANELRLDDVQDIGIKDTEIDRVLLQSGDLLVVEGNGSIEQIGRVALWDGSIETCVHQNHIIKVRFEPTDLGEHVLFWLLSASGREQIVRVASSTSGLYTLSLSKVSSLPVPLAPLAEQRRIVARIEALFAQANAVEAAVAAARLRLDRLDQAILARAFRGELVGSSFAL